MYIYRMEVCTVVMDTSVTSCAGLLMVLQIGYTSKSKSLVLHSYCLSLKSLTLLSYEISMRSA